MLPLAKNIKRYFSLKEFIVVFLAIVISVSAGVVVFLELKREVVITDNGTSIVLKTMKTTVKEVFEQNGIKVSPDDYLSLPLDSKLQKMQKNQIYIKRAVPISVLVDDQELKLMTYMDTVKEALANSPVQLNELDKLDGVNLDDWITRDMSIKVIRVKEETITDELPIPFKVLNRENTSLDKGTEKIVREGKEGIKQKQYKVTFENGKEVSRMLLGETVAFNPIDQLVDVGTVLTHKNSRGEVIRYKKIIDMKATAYTSSYKDTGKSPGDPGFGITYSGMKARKGIIAVDPKVIPLGTKLYVEVAGDTPDYGLAVAGDVGGAIKGNLIDLYFDGQDVVDAWGVKNVKVYILMDQ